MRFFVFFVFFIFMLFVFSTGMLFVMELVLLHIGCLHRAARRCCGGVDQSRRRASDQRLCCDSVLRRSPALSTFSDLRLRLLDPGRHLRIAGVVGIRTHQPSLRPLGGDGAVPGIPDRPDPQFTRLQAAINDST